MRTALIRTLIAGVTGCLGYAQTAATPLSFDVASVKPAAPLVPDGSGMIRLRGPSGGPGTKDPGRIDYPNMSLKNLLMNAYDVKNFQITGPAWMDTERFDVTATLPPETTKDQFRTMMQNLLAERFKMTIHRESKELPMFSMMVGKGGPKMKESAEVAAPQDGSAPPPPPPSQPKIGPDGFPILNLPPGMRGGPFMIMMMGRGRLIGQQNTMQELADRLSSLMNRPVTDSTELKAKYDFTLTFATEGMLGPMGPLPPGPPPPPPGGAGRGPGEPPPSQPESEPVADVFAAVQAQLGLKLEARKGPVPVIVVDHAEKTPIEN
jgi:uncharacterized protein (TIGR03435 family)